MSWQTVKLGDVCEIVSGATPKTAQKEYWDGDIFWATPKDLSGLKSKLIKSTERRLTEAGLSSCAAKVLPKNSVLFSSRAPIGLVAVNDVAMATNQGFKSFVPKENVLSSHYLYWWLKTNRSYLNGLGVGATFKEVSKSIVEKIAIPLPPLAEQKHIAAILDKADEVMAKREHAIAKLDELAQSTFAEMFGNTITNEKKWNEITLADLAVNKPNNGIFRKNDEYGKGLPVAWVEELFRGESLDLKSSRQVAATKAEIEKYGLSYGDLLFCRSSLKLDGIGYNNVYLGESNAALFECHLIRVKPNLDKVDPIFANFMLRSPASRENIKKNAKTVTMTTIDQDGLLRTKLFLPPMHLQKKFTNIFMSIVNQKTVLTKGLKIDEVLAASLQHQAFTTGFAA